MAHGVLSLTLTKLSHNTGGPVKLTYALSANDYYISLEASDMATKFTRPQSTWLLCVGCNAASIPQTWLEPKTSPELKSALQQKWDDDQQSYLRLLQTSECMRFSRW